MDHNISIQKNLQYYSNPVICEIDQISGEIPEQNSTQNSHTGPDQIRDLVFPKVFPLIMNHDHHSNRHSHQITECLYDSIQSGAGMISLVNDIDH